MVEGIHPGAPELDADTDLTSVLDSLDFVDLVFQVQERFGVDIPDEAIDERGLSRLGELVRYVDERS
jgi:acyl carrier protein